jgi:hypothetical protein
MNRRPEPSNEVIMLRAEITCGFLEARRTLEPKP